MIDIEKQRGNNYQRFDVQHPNQRKSSAGLNNSEEYERAFNVNTRIGFIRKVYGILSVQLLLTAFLCILSQNSKGFETFQRQNVALAWVAIGIEVVTMLALVCVPTLGRQVPLNYVLLGLFTVAEAYSVSFFTIFFSGNIVLLAAVMTAAVVVALTIYAMTTKTDFTVAGGTLFVIGAVLSMLVLVNFFIQSSIMQLLLSGAFSVLFGIYLVYDTQLIVGGKYAELEYDDYIWGALMLYTDIIGLFLNILQLLGAANRD